MQYEIHQRSFSPTSRSIYCRIMHHAADPSKDLCCIGGVCHYVRRCRWDNGNIFRYRMHGARVCWGIKEGLSIWNFYVGRWNCWYDQSAFSRYFELDKYLMRLDIITEPSNQANEVIHASIRPSVRCTFLPLFSPSTAPLSVSVAPSTHPQQG